MIVVAQGRTIAHESAGNDKLSLEIDRRHRVLGRQPHDLFTHLTEKWCRRHKKGSSVLLHAAYENGFQCRLIIGEVDVGRWRGATRAALCRASHQDLILECYAFGVISSNHVSAASAFASTLR